MTLLLLGLLACAPTAPPAAPVAATAPVATHSLVGDITAIELQNINKTQGRFTYNVELVVAVRSLEPAPTPPVSELRVRVAQSVPWAEVSEAERAQIAPNGPAQRLTGAGWRGYAVNDPVEMDVRLAGFDLAFPAQRAEP